MKYKLLLFVALLLAFATLGSPRRTLAYTPVLNISSSGNQITLNTSNADRNMQVELSVVNAGSTLPTTFTNNYWITDYNGNFSTTIEAQSYGITYGASLYVTVGGAQSNWQTYSGSSGGTPGQLTLSQTSLTLNQGQSSALYAYSSYGTVYLSSNSNSSVASASISGSTITVYGSTTGSTTMQFCAQSGYWCATLYVTVTGSSSGQLTFSNQYPSLSVGQSQTVTVYGTQYYNQNYYVSQNTNQSALDASISGNSLYLYGKANGSATVTVCQSIASSNCGYVYVTVGGGQSSGNVWFSPTNPSLYVGQSLAVSINSSSYPLYGSQSYYQTTYYVSSNSNSDVATASINGTVLNLYGNKAGTTTIRVCHSSLSYCGDLYVTVQGSGYGQQNITFSNANPRLSLGETQDITIYSQNNAWSNTWNYNWNSNWNYNQNNNYYIQNNSNIMAVSASIYQDKLKIQAQQQGNANITVCQFNTNNCGIVYVTVTGFSGGSSYYQNGQLINDNGTIYIVYKNTKTPFANAQSFLGFGFKFEHADSNQAWNMVNSGYVINTSNASHPWGSWIVRGSTVYFVHEQGLIPIPSWDMFLNNGGQERLLVQANNWDMQRPQLSLMAYNDSRLR